MRCREVILTAAIHEHIVDMLGRSTADGQR